MGNEDMAAVREQIKALAAALEAAGVRLDTAHAADGTPADLFHGVYAVVAEYASEVPGLIAGNRCVVAQANTNFKWSDDLGRLMALLLANWPRLVAASSGGGD